MGEKIKVQAGFVVLNGWHWHAWIKSYYRQRGWPVSSIFADATAWAWDIYPATREYVGAAYVLYIEYKMETWRECECAVANDNEHLNGWPSDEAHRGPSFGARWYSARNRCPDALRAIRISHLPFRPFPKLLALTGLYEFNELHRRARARGTVHR